MSKMLRIPHSQADRTARRSSTGNVKLAYVTHLPITQWLFLRGQNWFMAEQGFELHSISSPGRRLRELADRDNVTIHEVPIARCISPVQDPISLIRLFFALRRVRPDIVHLSTPKGAFLGALASRCAGVPVRLFLVRGFTSAQTSGLLRRIYCRLERFTVRLCTSTVCNAPSLLEYGRREGILGEREGRVLRSGMSNGINVSYFDPLRVEPLDLRRAYPKSPPIEHPVVIGFVGRLARDKGIDILARAWKVIRRQFADAILMLVGPWETKETVSAETRTLLCSDDRVILTGAVDDVRRFYRTMDLFVMPSLGEGLPNASMEAAAFGIPVVTTSAIGSRDAVQDGVTGTLVTPGSDDLLVNALQQYLADPALRFAHGQAGRRRVLREFRQEPLWQAIYEHYVELLTAKQLSTPQSKDEHTCQTV